MPDAVTAPLVDPIRPLWSGMRARVSPRVVVGLVAGIVAERVPLAWTKAWSERSGRGCDGALIPGWRGGALAAGASAGVYGATRHLGMGVWPGPVTTGLVLLLTCSLMVAVARTVQISGGMPGPT